MSARLGFAGGLLALTLTEAVLSSKQATGNVSGLLGSATTIFRHLTDPSIPGIPDRRATVTSAPASPGPAAVPAGPGPLSQPLLLA